MEAIALDEMYERIEQLCREAGVNVTTMCREAGVPRSALSDYKAGRIKSLAADKLAKIAGYFNVSVDHLLGKEEKPAAPKDGELVKDELIGFYGDVKEHLTAVSYTHLQYVSIFQIKFDIVAAACNFPFVTSQK